MWYTTLESSINIAPTKKFLSKFSLHPSIIFMNTCCVLYKFLYAAEKGGGNVSVLETRQSFENVS